MSTKGPGSTDSGSGVDLLAHHDGDHVAVAVRDVPRGEVHVAWLGSGRRQACSAADEIPFGHKMALADLAQGDEVIEYGARIGVTTRPIRRGELVHTHNVRSARWQSN
ncbi:MAG: UxaA family hydrolase [Acidimicrobiales bacterium]